MAGRVPVILDADETDQLPALVFVALSIPIFGGVECQVELRTTSDGRVGLPVYSSSAAFEACYGTQRTAMEVPARELAGLRRLVGFDVVLLDVAIPDELQEPAWTEQDAQLPLAQPPEPGKVWIPSRPYRAGSPTVKVELHPDENGCVTMAVYTSVEQLTTGCGQFQPAIAIPFEAIESFAAGVGAETVSFNPTLRSEARHDNPPLHGSDDQHRRQGRQAPWDMTTRVRR